MTDRQSLSRGPLGRRIAVIGTSGAGKTTTAAALAHRLGIPHVELDALSWGPSWTVVPLDQLRERTAQALSGEAWTVDGNYSKLRDIVWGRADTVVWLDFSRPVVMARVIRRTLKRIITRQELWNGNRETWRGLFARDSIVLWSWQTYRRRRAQYPELLAQPEYAHLAVVHLRSPHEVKHWLAAIGTA